MINSICLFSSYSASANIAEYVRVYIDELRRHFEKIIFITNEREISHDSLQWLQQRDIDLMQVKNEGFDFGMWYKALKKYDCSQYDRVGLINDSCVLFKKLDDTFAWINSSGFDYCGLVASNRYSYHIQSYFIVMNKRAFPFVNKYFTTHGIVDNYWEVIQQYEIGLNKYLLANGIKLGALYENITLTSSSNPSFSLLPELIRAGIPMIKKKILFNKYRPGEIWGLMLMNFDIDARNYLKLIIQVNGDYLLVDMEKILKQENVKEEKLFLFMFRISRHIAQFLRQFYFIRLAYKGLVKIKRLLMGRL